MLNRIYMCVWGIGYHNCYEQAKVEHHELDFFTFDNGYGKEDLKKISKLEIGMSCNLLDSGNHSITRIQ